MKTPIQLEQWVHLYRRLLQRQLLHRHPRQQLRAAPAEAKAAKRQLRQDPRGRRGEFRKSKTIIHTIDNG